MSEPIPPGRRPPLDGVLVLDLSRVLAGPLATMLLADLGARVVKVEDPRGGDPTRSWAPPSFDGESAYFLSVNRRKESIALDLSRAEDAGIVRKLALLADVVVENFLPGTLAPFGLDAASLRRDRPELIVCSITGHGQDGPYAHLPGYDAVMQGFVGLQSVTGEPDGPPLKVGVALIDVLTGVHAASAILASLVGRLRGRGGAHLDVALSEVGVASLVNVTQSALATGRPARRHGTAHPTIVPYQTFTARDGAFVVAVGNDGQWQRLCTALEAPGRATGAWAANPDRVLQREEVVGWLAARFADGTRGEWVQRLQAAQVPCGPVREVHEVVADPALESRGMLQSAPLADGGSTRILALPWRIQGERRHSALPPPRLGQDTAAFRERFRAG